MKNWQLSYLAGSVTLIVVCLTIVWLFPSENQSVGILLPDNAAFVSAGAAVYAKNCASCHGANLEGQVADWKSPDANGRLPAPPHDDTGHTWHHPDQTLFDITKFGVAKAANLENYVSAMPAYKDLLSDREIIAALSYIKSRWPEEVQNRHDSLNKR